MNAFRTATAAVLLALSLAGAARAQDAPASAPAAAAAASSAFHIRPVDDAWRRALPRDADAATQAYLDRLPADVVARSNAYFEGGYWLQLWNFLLGLGVAWLLLRRGLSARVRDALQRRVRVGMVRDALYGAFYAIASTVLAFPLAVYQGFVREHQYGMATQTFVPWLADQAVGLGVQVVATMVGVAVLYAVIRRAGERWWIWGTAATMVMFVFAAMLAPVLVDPLTNTYKPVTDPAVKDAVLTMARADDVPVDNVYVFDASRQTTRVSANVSGLFGTAAVRLNDNLMRTSLPEIRAVMGHELGHYVMNHIDKSLCEMALLMLVVFQASKRTLDALLRRHGAAWGLHGVADVAGLPLFVAVLSTFLFLATPILNTMTRVQEIEADRFGLNLAREPHGEAEVDLKLTEYRKPDPGPLEEFVFFDHPSTRHRIHDAMQWRQAMGTP